jgi:hypothetical protein
VKWLGEENAATAGMALMVALGGPVKTAFGMAFDASPFGQGINDFKTGVINWLTPVTGTYLFGANTDAQQLAVNPASHAVAGTTTEVGGSLLGVSLASSVKGIIALSKGFGGKVDVANDVQANKALGDAFEAEKFKEFQGEMSQSAQQITVRTESGIRTRLDLVGRDSDGNIVCRECKATATAPLTRNQRVGFPEIDKSGAVVVGKGKPGFEGGTVIPPTKVEIIRPDKPIPPITPKSD